MSKHTVTMKSLIDENAQLRIHAHKLEVEHPNNLLRLMWLPTPGNCWPCFWDGVMALAYRR